MMCRFSLDLPITMCSLCRITRWKLPHSLTCYARICIGAGLWLSKRVLMLCGRLYVVAKFWFCPISPVILSSRLTHPQTQLALFWVKTRVQVWDQYSSTVANCPVQSEIMPPTSVSCSPLLPWCGGGDPIWMVELHAWSLTISPLSISIPSQPWVSARYGG